MLSKKGTFLKDAKKKKKKVINAPQRRVQRADTELARLNQRPSAKALPKSPKMSKRSGQNSYRGPAPKRSKNSDKVESRRKPRPSKRPQD